MDEATRKEKIEAHKKRVNLIFQDCEKCLDIMDNIKKMEPEEIIEKLKQSGLKGRGGAGFPTWLKWREAMVVDSDEKYVICNADEGEPGTFKDREILQEQAPKVLAGMAICGYVLGAREGYIYLRGEYNYLLENLEKELAEFNSGLKEKGIDFEISIRSGSGAYVCGEETALIESMEGHRGEPRNKPPFPPRHGFMGQPTVVNNVETLVYAFMVMLNGPEKFKELGTMDSTGAKVFCVSGDASVEGIYELEMGMGIGEFVEMFGTGDTKAVQVGGAAGTCVPRKKFKDTVLGFEGVPTGGSMMLFDSSRSMYHVLHNYLEFFQEESCGQCTPCRVGCQQLLKGIEAVKTGERPREYLDDLIELAENMRVSAKCGLGISVANPFISIVKNFREEIIF
ncbi:MAG: NADH-ubiquinone oxidoreductase-F iron-sulfur binding region domain-containing protein [bacterium]